MKTRDSHANADPSQTPGSRHAAVAANAYPPLKSCLSSRLVLLAALLAALTATMQAQFNYEIHDGTVTITGYIGPGGDVVIPDTLEGKSVTSIGDSAFDYCTSLTSITIPNSVRSIGEWTFSGCTGLTAITVHALNPAYSSLDGVLFDKDQTTLIQCPALKLGTYTIPNSVTSIEDGAFYYCTSLTSIVIPNSVTRIDYGAFEGCSSLTSITIPDSVTWIDSGAFEGCTGLTTVTIGNSVSSIDEATFKDCTSLTAINVDALNASYSSFDGVLFNKDQKVLLLSPRGRNTIKIPPGVTSISSQALVGCWGLQAVYLRRRSYGGICCFRANHGDPVLCVRDRRLGDNDGWTSNG